MPNGFPTFRFDPTTAPRYLVVTSKTSSDVASRSTDLSSDTASRSTDSSQQSAKTVKQSEYQYPTERDRPKISHSKPKGKFQRLFR